MLKVIGIGDNVVDIYQSTQVMYPGGNALNFSVYAKQLGAEAAYLGILGNDAAGSHITHVLQEICIDITHCRHHHGENGYAEVRLINGDRVFTGGNEGGVSREYPIDLKENDLKYIRNFELVHTSCYSYMEEGIKVIKELGVPLSFDFSNHFDNEYLARVCPYVDFCFLSCSHLKDEAIEQLFRNIHHYGPKLIIGTMGSRGAILFNGEKIYVQQPVFVEPVDTLGAGDAFITAFLFHYLTDTKRGVLKDERYEQGMDELIRASLYQGALAASSVCLINGAFGYGKAV